MSVENVDSSSSTAGSFADKKENMKNLREKVEKVDLQQGGSPSPLVEEGVALLLSQSVEKPKNGGISTWMQNLDDSELLRVFTLSDVPFLASMLAVPSWSTVAEGGGGGQTDGSSTISSVVSTAESPSLWLHLVNSSEIRAVHRRICDDFKSGAGVLITSRWISSIQASIGKSRSNMSSSSQAGATETFKVDDSAIRIRQETEDGVDGESMSDIEAFWSILEHVRVVFPSAVSFVTGGGTTTAATSNESSTLITLSPSLIRKLGARKVFDALNAGLRSFLPGNDFLTEARAAEGSWVDLLLAAAESKEESDGLQIPLFAVLLFRLEHAFYEAYQASVAASVEQLPIQEVTPRSTSDSFVQFSVFTDGLGSSLEGLENATITDEQRESVTSELAKACGGADWRNIGLADLVLTPLALVSRSMETEGIGSLASVDEIIKAALERCRSIISKDGQSTTSKKNGHATESAPALKEATQQQSPASVEPQAMVNAKKKKKRKPKKKQPSKGKGADQSKIDIKADQSVQSDAKIESVDSKKQSTEGVTDSPGVAVAAQKNPGNGTVDSRTTAATSVEVVAGEGSLINESAPARVAGKGETTTKIQKEATPPASSEKAQSDVHHPDHGHDDGDTWETVEVKPRTQRKKGFERSNTLSSRNSTNTSSGHNESNPRKGKEKRTAASRKKNATRKMVREILSNVVDSVEDESSRKQKIPAVPVTSENRWMKGPPVPGSSKQTSTVANGSNRPKSLRDIVLGGSSVSSPRPSNVASPAIQNADASKGKKAEDTAQKSPVVNDQTKRRQQPGDSPEKRTVPNEPSKKSQINKNNARKTEPALSSQKRPPTETKPAPKLAVSNDSPVKQNSSKWVKGKATPVADQNTAPTYQETVSAMSGTSNRISDRPAVKANNVEPSSKSDSSAGDTDEAPQNLEREASPTEKESASGPPLLTFVSPENANSATSSVASSLEVPHASRRHHHSTSTPDVADVGYHLLDVCDRLSRDMRLFMSSREQAINIRRRERGAVLTALQDSLSGLWPAMCRVEMYGSCATLLDLPSSDLDVVVVGLDHSEMMIANQMAAASQQKSKRSNSSNEVRGRTPSIDGSAAGDDGLPVQPPPPTHSPHMHHTSYVQLPIYRNSERVKMLAQKLDGQPWAVKVKSLPNASVPVIKILADPSKLPGTVTGSEWPSPSSDNAVSAEENAPEVSAEGADASAHQAPSQNLYEPWRGSDVMNGLISLDITFEGPEHGGLGSTDFSVHVVSEACQEANSPPESTPFVQCLMVLKELLVQRKLNEPYSGGLSSYALLLLLLGLVRERSLIREEIERVERQRQAMAEGGNATYAGALVGVPADDADENPIESAAVEPSAGSMKHSRSWANIAKKPNQTPTPSVSSEPPSRIKQEQEKSKPKLDRPASFADAVARSTVSMPGRNGAEHNGKEPIGKMESVKTEPIESNSGNQPPDRSDAVDQSGLGMPSFYPQGFDDVIEVLCTGETTAGKLLMHFLLYYGQYFDAQSTAIDISGKHERVFMGHHYSPYSYLSPYIPRRAPETIDPHTGMLVVDHIVIYDPLEGAENNNVARRCFAWQQVKWIFAQSYATLSSAVERSATPPATPNARPPMPDKCDKEFSVNQELVGGDLMDPSSPLLRCLLAF